MPVPRVSVLLPIYNARDTLSETLESLLAQSLSDLEIVALDDGSTDGSDELLRQWAVRDTRLRTRRSDHRGLIATLNAGIALCRSQSIARMDADDLAHPRRLEEQARMLEADPHLSVVGCLVEAFPSQRVGEGFRIYLDWLNGLVDHEAISREFFIESPIVHPSAMVRRRELVQLGGYMEHGWPEDYDLWLRYLLSGRRFAKVPEMLLSWREHDGRLTHNDGRYSVENFLRAKAHYLIKGPLRNRDGLMIWGAGRNGRRLSKHLIRGGFPPSFFIDVTPKKIGNTLRQLPIVAPTDLPELWSQFRNPLLIVAVRARGARDLIRAELEGMHYWEGKDYLFVA